jgi:rhodanese-related sulfurtransferase
VFVPLGSTANKHGHVIGDNITGGQSTFPGIVGTTVFKVLDYNLACTGLTEKRARQLGYSVLTTLVPGPDRAHYYPTAATLLVKLVADATTGRLLGAQVLGPGDAVKRIDVLATALTFGATMDNLPDLDLGYAPPYSSAVDPLAHAANVLRNKRDGLAKALTPQQLKAKLNTRDPLVLLDVRTAPERDQMQLHDPRVVWIPLGQLRKRVDELPRDREMVCFCKVSQRGYEAQRILDGEGFANVKFLDGGLIAWPYSLEADNDDDKEEK